MTYQPNPEIVTFQIYRVRISGHAGDREYEARARTEELAGKMGRAFYRRDHGGPTAEIVAVTLDAPEGRGSDP